MIKRILPLIILIASVGQLSAQKKEFEKELYIGVGGGALSSSVDFMPKKAQLFYMGMHGGVSAKFISEKNLGFLLELNYKQKGWAEEFDEDVDFEYSRMLNYVEIPFMTHVYFGNKLRFVLNAGPQIGYMIGSSSKMNDSFKESLDHLRDTSPNDRVVLQYDGELRKFDYGLIGGLGIDFNTNAGSIQLEGRYYFGLGDIFESRRSKNNVFNRSANRNIEAKLTYYFRLN